MNIHTYIDLVVLRLR